MTWRSSATRMFSFRSLPTRVIAKSQEEILRPLPARDRRVEAQLMHPVKRIEHDMRGGFRSGRNRIADVDRQRHRQPQRLFAGGQHNRPFGGEDAVGLVGRNRDRHRDLTRFTGLHFDRRSTADRDRGRDGERIPDHQRQIHRAPGTRAGHLLLFGDGGRDPERSLRITDVNRPSTGIAA